MRPIKLCYIWLGFTGVFKLKKVDENIKEHIFKDKKMIITMRVNNTRNTSSYLQSRNIKVPIIL